MAKIPQDAPANQLPAMLQVLLAKRFAVKLRKESRNLPGYELAVAKGGPKLKEVDGPVTMRASFASDGPTFGGNMRMSHLAEYLTAAFDRPVLDVTGLESTYEIHLPYHQATADIFGGRIVVVGAAPDNAAPVIATR
jgi:uncharacterized protein (TIGR03435 family)